MTTVSVLMTDTVIDYQIACDAIHLPNNCGLSIFMKRVDPRPVPIFSQEIPDHVGVFLNDLTPAERKKYFEEAKKYTGLDYQ